jgi:hypothetical protein
MRKCAMSPSTIEASPEQVAKVKEVVERSMPRGAMIERIGKQTGFTTDIICSAIHALETEGIVVGRNPFAYDPIAVDESK